MIAREQAVEIVVQNLGPMADQFHVIDLQCDDDECWAFDIAPNQDPEDFLGGGVILVDKASGELVSYLGGYGLAVCVQAFKRSKKSTGHPSDDVPSWVDIKEYYRQNPAPYDEDEVCEGKD